MTCTYRESTKEMLEKKEIYRHDLFAKSFNILAPDGRGRYPTVTLSQIRKLFALLRPELPQEMVDLFFYSNASVIEGGGGGPPMMGTILEESSKDKDGAHEEIKITMARRGE